MMNENPLERASENQNENLEDKASEKSPCERQASDARETVTGTDGVQQQNGISDASATTADEQQGRIPSEESVATAGEQQGKAALGESDAAKPNSLARTDPSSYAYRWSYDTQVACDQAENKQQSGKKGAIVYAVVMSVAFLLCLAILTVTLVLNGVFPWSSSVLTTSEVAEIVNPCTVLIYASGNTQAGYGTGFFVRSDGYIVTNYHVIEGAKTISVTLYSGEEHEASAMWYSWSDDLAILKIDGKGYPTLAIGNSDALKVGDTAIAIGNPAGNLAPWTTTQGIISALHRVISVEENTAIVDMVMLQTDAQVNPGNSGGPLCNDRGEVIGIVTRKMSEYEGVGLAIPINEAMELINAYLTTGSTEHVTSGVSRVRPTMGIQAATIKEGQQIFQNDSYVAPRDGVLVVDVTSGGAADGILEPGDIILKMGNTDIFTLEQLRTKLYTYSSGNTVTLIVDRLGEQLTLKLRLGTARAS